MGKKATDENAVNKGNADNSSAKKKYKDLVSVEVAKEGLIFKLQTKEKDECEHTAIDNGELIKCLDQAVGVLEVSVNNGMGHVKWRVNNIKKTDDSGKRVEANNTADYKSMVIVLESPHRDEFTKRNNTAKQEARGPAMGHTGDCISEALCKNIFCYLTMRNYSDLGAYSNFNTAIENGQYCVHFVNAIQVQCSLGLALSEYEAVKKSNLKGLWDKKIVRDDFVERLKKRKPAVIINCCTDVLQNKVQKEIDENFTCLKLMGDHPSSPFFYRGFKDA